MPPGASRVDSDGHHRRIRTIEQDVCALPDQGLHDAVPLRGVARQADMSRTRLWRVPAASLCPSFGEGPTSAGEAETLVRAGST